MVRSFRSRLQIQKTKGRRGSPFFMMGVSLPAAEALRLDAMSEFTESAAGKISEGQRLTLQDVRSELGDCQRCPLGRTRKNLVFGEGNPHADIVFVGEAPGADEDFQGRPFVGRAGQLLTKIVEAMNLGRKDVYICNILKCRPPGNRNPQAGEIEACEPFLIKQLEAIGPKVICALGTFAAKTLLKVDVPITVLRGRFHSYRGIKLMPTYHPAYLLRNPSAKRLVWEDVQMIMRELE
ncbi:MAG: uracil-DNA glycosylase [Deltaproteobacteria bacterium]|nr:uracil-DNA glycosylase [Deltaproteobacteria bacterium]